jgi:regulator of sirC expression with transglutaminase-like and TPR domain
MGARTLAQIASARHPEDVPDPRFALVSRPRTASDPSAEASSFEALAAQDDAAMDVAVGAALIARDVYGNLDVDALLARFDELAAPLVEAGLALLPPRAQALALAEHLYVSCSFSGNEKEYYDPRNSLISDVLERRLGIPITLALVYCEVARRVGVRARGVGFPGHFLVRIDPVDRDEPVLVDPFFGGKILDDEALGKLLERVTGKSAPIRVEHLAPASARAVLLRILHNLRGIYLSRGDTARAMLVIDRMVCLTPNAPEPLRERGLLSAKLGATSAAQADLQRFLELAPFAEDAPQIRARLKELKAKKSVVN